MISNASEWFMLTPAGVLHAFMKEAPGETELALQALLTGERALDAEAWAERSALAGSIAAHAIQEGWVQVLQRPLQSPDAKLDDFLQHVIASLSGERRAVLASEGGFCLGRSGIDQDEADALSAAAADYSDFATRQARRGWRGAKGFVSFHVDADFLQHLLDCLCFSHPQRAFRIDQKLGVETVRHGRSRQRAARGAPALGALRGAGGPRRAGQRAERPWLWRELPHVSAGQRG